MLVSGQIDLGHCFTVSGESLWQRNYNSHRQSVRRPAQLLHRLVCCLLLLPIITKPKVPSRSTHRVEHSLG